MKKVLAGISLILVLTFCFCTAASCWTVSELIAEMEKGVDPEEVKMKNDNSETVFEQSIVYDEETMTFTHVIYCPAFVYPCFARLEDYGFSMDEIWDEIWKDNRMIAEKWLLNDFAASLGIPGSTVVMKFVSCMDEESEDYLVYYAITMGDDFKVTNLENNQTDDFEPVLYD